MIVIDFVQNFDCLKMVFKEPFIKIFIRGMDKEENTPQFIKQLPWYAQDSKGGG